MTTIVALHTEDNGTFIGADSQLTYGGMRAGPVMKWVTHPSGWAAGAAGHYATITLMQDRADLLFRNLLTPDQFLERLRGVLHKSGFSPMADEPGPITWGNMTVMLAHPTGLWDFDGTLSFYRIPAGTIWAAGSGKEYAFGAGSALQGIERDLAVTIPPEDLVQRSLRAAMERDVASGGNAWVHHLPLVKSRPRTKLVKPAIKRKHSVAISQH